MNDGACVFLIGWIIHRGYVLRFFHKKRTTENSIQIYDELKNEKELVAEELQRSSKEFLTHLT